jgi:hypothetical protein
VPALQEAVKGSGPQPLHEEWYVWQSVCTNEHEQLSDDDNSDDDDNNDSSNNTNSNAIDATATAMADYLQITGSFKERGALNSLLQLSARARKKGVIAASAGNHALALAHHGALLQIPVTVCMPTTAPLTKACRSLVLVRRACCVVVAITHGGIAARRFKTVVSLAPR